MQENLATAVIQTMIDQGKENYCYTGMQVKVQHVSLNTWKHIWNKLNNKLGHISYELSMIWEEMDTAAVSIRTMPFEYWLFLGIKYQDGQELGGLIETLNISRLIGLEYYFQSEVLYFISGMILIFQNCR